MGRPSSSSRLRAVVLLAAVAVAAPLALAGPAMAEPVGVEEGTLDWGVKASFRAYIIGPIAQGAVTTTAGAVTNADGTYRFPDAAGARDGGTIDVAFAGTVQFTGHSGAVDLTISDVRLRSDAAGAALVVDMVSKSLEGAELVSYPDVALVTLDLDAITPVDDGASTTWVDVPASLTAEGSLAFADFYPPGTAMDPVTITLGQAVDLPASTTTTAAPAPATTTATVATVPVATASPTAPTAVQGSTTDRTALPATGSTTALLAAVALTLLATGAGLRLLSVRLVSRGSAGRGSSRDRPGG